MGGRGELGYRKKLERRVNDLEFGGVRSGVEIGEGVGWGPYVDRVEWEEEEEMDDNEHDDSDSDW